MTGDWDQQLSCLLEQEKWSHKIGETNPVKAGSKAVKELNFTLQAGSQEFQILRKGDLRDRIDKAIGKPLTVLELLCRR